MHRDNENGDMKSVPGEYSPSADGNQVPSQSGGVSEQHMGNTVDTAFLHYYSGIDWGTVAFRLLEKIHWIVLAAVLGAVIAWFYATKMITPIYQAQSKIYIAGSDTSISLTDLQLGSTLAVDYSEVFKIWHVHEMVDEKLNLNYSYGQLSSMVSVSNPTGSHLLYIYIKSTDPEEARLLADTYAEVVQDYITNKMELRRPQIIEKARTPASPIYPNVRSMIITGLLAGGFGMTAIFLFMILLDDRIRSGDDVTKAVDLPTFGMIPRQDMEKNTEQSEVVRGIANPGVHDADVQGDITLDFAGEEAINTICSSITFVGKSLKRLVITSCRPNEGKSFQALQIAIGMTRRGKRVLLMDADLRLSVMKTHYRIRLGGAGKGLAHLLSGQCTLEDAIYRTNIPGLYFLSDGASVKTPMTLLTSPDFDQLMATLGESFDLVIVDTPPLGAVVDAAEIARHCDGVMLVLEYNRTRKRMLQEAISLLRQTGTPILGCIVNKVAVSHINKGRYASHYYGGYYGYGYGYRKNEYAQKGTGRRRRHKKGRDDS